MQPAPPASRGPAIEQLVRRLVSGPRDAVVELARAAVQLGGGAAAVVLEDLDGSLRVVAREAAVDRRGFAAALGGAEITQAVRAAFVEAHPDLPLASLPPTWADWARANEPLRSVALPLSSGDRVHGWLWVGAALTADRLSQLRDLTAVAALRHGHEAAVRASTSELVEHEAMLSERTDAVEVANQAFDSVGVRIGYDVRDAAREVLGWCRVGTDVELDATQHAELLVKIRRAAERLGGVLGDVMEDLEEVRADRRDAITVDLNGPMGWVRRVLADQIELRGADLRVDPLPTIMATSPTVLRGVLLELVRNAIEHGGAGVRVHVGVGRVDGVVELVVEDDGPGIPEDLREIMFEAGFTTGTGVGLGLARVRHGVALLGGTVRAHESATGGTAVHVTLPRHGATVQEPVKPVAPAAD